MYDKIMNILTFKYVADRNIISLHIEYSPKYSILDVITITERPISSLKDNFRLSHMYVIRM